MNRGKERGVALIMTMIILGVLSAMAVSFMFLSSSETWSTLNYRLTSQARDAAEAGLNAATNFFVNNGTYTPPTTGGTDPITAYTLTTYPVQVAANGKTVGLSCSGASGCAAPSNLAYPVAAVQSAFNTNGIAYGTITNTVGNITTTAKFATYAILLAMRQINQYGNTTATVQTWQLISDGTVSNGVRTAQVELSAILEKPIVPAFNYAAFATSNQCAALTFSQAGTVVKSYDSSISPAPGGIRSSDGNVGTNGNLTISSNATIYGSLSTPATGTGSCVNGAGGASTAETACAGCTVSGGLVALPQTITYPLPAVPTPISLTAQSGNTDCGSGGSAIPNCTVLASKKIQLDPGNYGQVTIGSSMTDVHLHNGGGTTAGIYNMDSFAMGNANLIIDSGPVVLNIAGCATVNGGGTNCATYLANPVNIQSTANVNATYNPSWLQIQYAGTQTVTVKCGNTVASALIYAPAASVNLTANGDFYGAVIGNTVTEASGATIFYDRNLQDNNFTVGNFALAGFNWGKF